MSLEEHPEAALVPLRDRIDAIDVRLVSLLADRMQCVDEVVAIKRRHRLPGRLEARVEDVVERVRAESKNAGAPPELAELLWRTMIEWIIAYEEARLAAGDPRIAGQVEF